MTQPFDLHSAAYDLMNGSQALRSLASDLVGHGDGEPLSARSRDHLVFVLTMVAEKAEACGERWVDIIELRAKVPR